ncbi:MAG: H4MPT-linked C1 transfer pathway protein [Planctomycetes bacterium]|nr:H4MPT-linked C1 transfer pathway protein [Planctomycetota bacterium]
MSYLGLDIGGANLKIADGRGYAASRFFPLWQRPHDLAEALGELIANAPAAEQLVVTMTGELADCFATKADGVAAILGAVVEVAGGRRVGVYLCDGRVVGVETARAEALLAGASNWHVLAGFVGRYCEGESGLLLDIGSTTSDIIPFDKNGPRAVGLTDPERLQAGELVYTGIERSPICAVTPVLSWRGELCPVAQELFATTSDAYVMLGELAEDVDDLNTADGRSRTKANARGRLARAVCADSTMFSEEDARRSAEMVRAAQLQQLEIAARQVLGRMETPPREIVLSGHGEFLARELIARLELDCRVVSLAEQLGREVSRCGCAHALAVLAREGACV